MSHKRPFPVIIVDMDIVNLVERAKQDDKTAFSELFNMYYTPVYRYIMSRSRDENLALDLTQDVFMKWYRSMSRYNLPAEAVQSSPLSYLFTIAKRLMINNGLKKRSVQLPDNADEFLDSGDVSVEVLIDIKLEIAQVYQYFDTLTESEREMIELKYMSELDNKEIAIVMEKSVDALRQIEHRALKKLRKMYQDDKLSKLNQ